MFRNLTTWRPDKFANWIGFSNEMAHRIEAGADMFLMPSRYEPCGLNQIYSLKYGTPPDVPATVRASVPVVLIGEPATETMPPVKVCAT